MLRAATVKVRSLALLALLAALLLAVPPGPRAQEAPAPPDAPQLEDLVQTIEDPVRREALLGQLRTLLAATRVAEPEAPPSFSARLVDAARDAAAGLRVAGETVVVNLGQVPVMTAWLRGLAADPAARGRGLQLAVQLLAILAAGIVAEVLAHRLLARPRAATASSAPPTAWAKVPMILARALLEGLTIVAFAAAAYAMAVILDPGFVVRGVALQIVNAYVVSRIVLLLARRVIAPGTPNLRLVPLSDPAASYLIGWVRGFVNTAVIGLFVIEGARLLGLPFAGYLGLHRALGLLLLLMWAAFVMRNRRAVAEWLRTHQTPLLPDGPIVQTARTALAATWHLVAIAYAAVFFVVSAWGVEGGFAHIARGTIGTVLILTLASWLAGQLRTLVQRAAGTVAIAQGNEPVRQNRLRRYGAMLFQALQVIVLVAALAGILFVWGADVAGIAALPLVERLGGVLLTAAVLIGLAMLAWELANAAIERYLRRPAAEDRRGVRARTLLPLLRKALLIILTIFVSLMILSELGIQIAPLLAGAGVVGLAIGFGAQKMVQDVITGFFILVEDTISVGDVVTVGGMSGLVEDLSIRSIRLRDAAGTVHTVPFSSVDTVSNMTKDFSFYVLNIAVAYDADTDRVTEVCRAIVDEMRGEDRFRYDILEPLEVFGVDKLAETAVVIQARIKTRPIKQWGVGREFNRRMKRRFDELGIEFPNPSRVLVVGNERGGTPPALAASLAKG